MLKLIRATTHHIHTKLLKDCGLKRTQSLEVVSSFFGFRTYASLKHETINLSDIAFIFLDEVNISNRLNKFSETPIKVDLLSPFRKFLIQNYNITVVSIQNDVVVELFEENNNLKDEIISSVEEHLSSEMAETNYIFDDYDFSNLTSTMQSDCLSLFVNLTVDGSPHTDRMLSTGPNHFEVSIKIEFKKLSPNLYGVPQVALLDTSSHNTFYDSDNV
jgi:hypothetical protein